MNISPRVISMIAQSRRYRLTPLGVRVVASLVTLLVVMFVALVGPNDETIYRYQHTQENPR